MPLFICSYRLFEYLYIVQASQKPVRGSSKSQRDDMNRIEESSARQYCPEYEALIDMNNELYTTLPISDLFPFWFPFECWAIIILKSCEAVVGRRERFAKDLLRNICALALS